MSKVNQPPSGLQALLGSQNFGDNPDNLLQDVRPTVDLFAFWASQSLRFLRDTTNSSGVGSVVEIQVPEGELWQILSAAFGAEVLVNSDDMNEHIALDQTITGSDFFIVASQAMINAGTILGQFYEVVWNPPQAFFVPGGTVIRGIHGGSNQAAKDFHLDVVYHKLAI